MADEGFQQKRRNALAHYHEGYGLLLNVGLNLEGNLGERFRL